ncbi:MAG: hypothetical protein AAGE76_00785 [Pseudomonadota bacterium]
MSQNGPLPAALTLPLRDVLRGLATPAAGSARLLQPAGRILPPPIRNALNSLAENLARPQHTAAIPVDDIHIVYGILHGTPPPEGARGAIARVLSYAVEVLRPASGRPPFLVSETVAALAATETVYHKAPATAPDRAADLFADLARSHSVGRVPGTGIGLDDADQAQIETTLITILVWLLTDRPQDSQEEPALLTLSDGLVTVMADDVAAARGGSAALAETLKRLSAMV